MRWTNWITLTRFFKMTLRRKVHTGMECCIGEKAISRTLVIGTSVRVGSEGLLDAADFSADALVRLCETAERRAKDSDMEAALEMQRKEWECLMSAAWKLAAGHP